MVKLVFISQPMNGKTDKEIHEERVQAIKEIHKLLEGENIVIIDSFVHNPAPQDLISKPLWYLGESLKIMSNADIIYFAYGSGSARGCYVEKICAEQYGKVVLTHDDYVERFEGDTE